MTTPLAGMSGTFTGSGFNAIFRPLFGDPNSDNTLQLSLTQETLQFTTDIGAVVNRGSVQPDITLSGAAYLQVINDVTDPNNPTAIHYEPGTWMYVPPTIDPALPESVVRMGAIAHGATINAQGTFTTVAGAPVIPPMNINPFVTATQQPVPTSSLIAATPSPARIPRDLSSQITAGTITQDVLNDPNVLLRNAIKGQNITSTTTLSVSTDTPAAIPFLIPNANPVSMQATFYIESVTASSKLFGFWPITRHYTQIQYTQQVLLEFNGNTYPHVSVATLHN